MKQCGLKHLGLSSTLHFCQLCYFGDQMFIYGSSAWWIWVERAGGISLSLHACVSLCCF